MGGPIMMSMRVAVRDWKHDVADGQIEAYLCVPAAANNATTHEQQVSVSTKGDVQHASVGDFRWDNAEDLVLPITARVERGGCGSLSVRIGSDSASQSTGVVVTSSGGRSVVQEYNAEPGPLDLGACEELNRVQ